MMVGHAWNIDYLTARMTSPAARIGLYRRAGGQWDVAWIAPEAPFGPADAPKLVEDARRALAADQQAHLSRDTAA